MWLLVIAASIGGILAIILKNGFTVITLMISLPVLYTLFNTIYSNSRKVRIKIRKFMNWINISTFDVEFQSTFKFKNDSEIKDINKDYKLIEELIYKVLKKEGYTENKSKLIDISLDRVSGVKFFIKPHKIYLSIDQSNDGGEAKLLLNVDARLKYRNGEKILNDFLLGIYEKIEDLNFSKDKYIVKMSKNTKKADFMKNHFVKELTPKEVSNFSIIVKEKNLNITISQERVTVVTNQKHDLIQGIRYSIELIN